MKLDKSYRLLNYLNASHHVLGRRIFAGFAYIFVLMVSRSFILAKLSWDDFVLDDFKLAFRRLVWFGRLITGRLAFLNDHLFDFTERTNIAQCHRLDRLLRRRVDRKKSIFQACDLLYVLAQKIHLNIDYSAKKKSVAKDISYFYELCTESLSTLPTKSAVSRAVKKDRDADFSRSDAVLALQDFARLLPIHIWNWYVISGTFLGLHREGGFLAHDYDIDIGIDGHGLDLDAVKTALVLDQSFVIKKIDHHVEILKDECGSYSVKKTPALLKLIHKNGLNIDLFIHHTQDGVSWHGSILHKWVNTPFELERRVLEGVEVLAPENAELYLTENYGNWRTPVKEFDCSTGTPNLVVSKNFKSIALFIKRLVLLAQTDPAAAMKLKRALVAAGLLAEDSAGLQIVEII
jgi:hypothetical protein